MPRFRFNWDNLDSSLTTSLCVHLHLPGVNPTAELRSVYGARPREDFVEDVWPVLMQAWLPAAEEALKRISTSLRERNVGDTSVSDDLQYVRSCRNTIGLRRVVLPEFITLGETAPDSMVSFAIPGEVREPQFGGGDRIGGVQPSPESAPGAVSGGSDRIGGNDRIGGSDRIGGNEDEGKTFPKSPQFGSDASAVPKSVDHLRLWVQNTLRTAFDDQSIEPDDEGDLSIPYGSVIPFITINDEPLRAEIYAVLLRDIEYSEQLLKTLNLINVRLIFEKIAYIPDQKMIVLSTQLNAIGMTQESLLVHLRMVTATSDYFDTQLHEQFGGRQLGEDRKQDEQVV